jgi:hypothetical protein
MFIYYKHLLQLIIIQISSRQYGSFLPSTNILCWPLQKQSSETNWTKNLVDLNHEKSPLFNQIQWSNVYSWLCASWRFFSSKINILGTTPTTSSVYHVYFFAVGILSSFFLPQSLQPITVSATLRGRVRQFRFKKQKEICFASILVGKRKKNFFASFRFQCSLPMKVNKKGIFICFLFFLLASKSEK